MTRGTTSPPIPLAVSATTLSGRSDPGSTKERAWSAYSAKRSWWSRGARVVGGGGRSRASLVRASISDRPVSRPMGRAPARQSLMPL